MRGLGIVALVAACGFHPPAESIAVDAAAAPDARDAGSGSSGSGSSGSNGSSGSATPFDPATCPSSYAAIVGAGSGSRYRVLAENNFATWSDAEQMCEADHNAATTPHLIVFETAAERKAVIGNASASIDDNFTWTGYYTRGLNMPWLAITGENMTDTGGWDVGQPIYDPNGQPMFGPNGASLQDLPDAVYVAEPFNFAYNVICECDGLPLVEP